MQSEDSDKGTDNCTSPFAYRRIWWSGLRDEGLLDSAINMPYQTFGGTDLYPGIVEKAGRLGYGLIKNHPFVDGNKRIGTHAMLVFLAINDVALEYNDNELVEIILAVAAGKVSDEELINWLVEHITTE